MKEERHEGQEEEGQERRHVVVWSYGGGVQSAGIAALIVLGRLPRPDLIVIADTGREVETTWEYMHDVIELALGEKIHVIPHSYSTVDLYGTNGDLLIPATTTQSGTKGRLPTFCSNEWKQRPVRRFLRERGIKSCDLWLGISRDECDRMKPSGLDWLTHVYPLIEQGIHRRDCLPLTRSLGWPDPAKSRCYMCPHQNATEWASLTNADLARAVLLDREVREKDPHAFVHSSGLPLLKGIAAAEDQPSLFDGCDSGWCWT